MLVHYADLLTDLEGEMRRLAARLDLEVPEDVWPSLVDAARSWAQAIAVAGGRIIAVGTDAEVSALIEPRTEVIDLAGRMLLPGFTDSHVHASGAGLERIRCDLSGAHSLDDYLAAVRRYARRHPAAAWITCSGHGAGHR